jgi:hypothetical protein
VLLLFCVISDSNTHCCFYQPSSPPPSPPPSSSFTIMFRQYDSDNTVWSPQGRLFQIEYATEAVKRGSACVGLRSSTHAVLAGLKIARSQLASYQDKVFALDEHLGVAISGLTGDARVLSQYMRREAMNHRYIFESSLPINRLVTQLSDSMLLFGLLLREQSTKRSLYQSTTTQQHQVGVPTYSYCNAYNDRGSSSHTTLWPSPLWCWILDCWL